MTALGSTDRRVIALTRQLAAADTREQLTEALAAAESPSLDIHGPEIRWDLLQAAALGQAQGLGVRLIEIIERLDGQLAQAAEMLAEDSAREADFYIASTRAMVALEAGERPTVAPGPELAEDLAAGKPAGRDTSDRCAICHRESHRPGLLAHGNHGHAYVAPEDAPAEDLAPVNPVPNRTVWRVNEDSTSARELATYPGPQADRAARELNGNPSTRPHIHYMSLPLGALPFDYETEADRRNALAEDPDPMGLDGYRDTARDSRS